MYSTFIVSKTECVNCSNITLKGLGTLQGVFGAEIDQIDGKITVSHTDEISRGEIADRLMLLGYAELIDNSVTAQNFDEPSVWGCVL